MRRELAACADLEERARCALALLVETTGALAGHLYGMRGERLTRLASHNAGEPAAELTRGLEAFVSSVNESDAHSTAIVSADGGTTCRSATALRDADGRSYEPFALSTAIDNAVAAVALAFANGARNAPPSELLTAVGEELTVRGDITAIATLR